MNILYTNELVYYMHLCYYEEMFAVGNVLSYIS